MNLPRHLERDLSEMLGIAKGVLADGVVSNAEASLLREWLTAHPDVVAGWPGNILSQRLRQVFEDGVVTAEESGDLGDLLRGLLGGEIGIVRTFEGAIALPLDDPLPRVELRDHLFVLTGRFAFGPKSACEKTVRRGGGWCEEAITRETDYFVIGTFGSRDWIHSNWALSVAMAVEQRRQHGRLHIISEDHWAAALASVDAA